MAWGATAQRTAVTFIAVVFELDRPIRKSPLVCHSHCQPGTGTGDPIGTPLYVQ